MKSDFVERKNQPAMSEHRFRMLLMWLLLMPSASQFAHRGVDGRRRAASTIAMALPSSATHPLAPTAALTPHRICTPQRRLVPLHEPLVGIARLVQSKAKRLRELRAVLGCCRLARFRRLWPRSGFPRASRWFLRRSQAGPESNLAPPLGIVRRRHRIVGLEPEALAILAGVSSCCTARWRFNSFCGLPQIRHTRWSGRMERRTDTAGSGFSSAGWSGFAPTLLSWPATILMSPASSDGAIWLFETYAETISAVRCARLDGGSTSSVTTGVSPRSFCMRRCSLRLGCRGGRAAKPAGGEGDDEHDDHGRNRVPDGRSLKSIGLSSLLPVPS